MQIFDVPWYPFLEQGNPHNGVKETKLPVNVALLWLNTHLFSRGTRIRLRSYALTGKGCLAAIQCNRFKNLDYKSYIFIHLLFRLVVYFYAYFSFIS